jgi:N-acetylmuramoyl-L-alanine amidase
MWRWLSRLWPRRVEVPRPFDWNGPGIDRTEDTVKVVAVASPNHNARPAGTVVDCIVLHCDAARDAKASISWIKSKESKVSYHVLVDRDGTVYRFVETNRRAWHAGASEFMGRKDCNNYSLGLSFANDNAGEPYTAAQYESAAIVVLGWMSLYPKITLDRITTHAAVALPAGRKTDPVGFDLERLRRLIAVPPPQAA